MGTEELSIFAVFLTGLLGGVHCAGMCGGIVAALGMTQGSAVTAVPVKHIPMRTAAAGSFNPHLRTLGVGSPRSLRPVALYNVGRVLTYAMLGSLAGAMGSLAWITKHILPVQQSAFLLSNLLLILMGLYLFGVKRLSRALESLGALPWRYIRPLATRTLNGQGYVNSLLAGSLWGLVPVGLSMQYLQQLWSLAVPGRERF